MIRSYLKSLRPKRMIVMVLGNVFLGLGVSIFKLAGLGNDTFNGMLMALAELASVPYARLFVYVSVGLFVVELLTGKKYIGPGTLVNTFFLGYIVSFFYDVLLALFPAPQVLWAQLPVMLAGVVVCSFGLSLYQTPDVGISPYDSLSLILTDYFPRIPYFWCRMFTDGLCALICFLAGGLVGLGTLAAAFGLGPVIHFFNVHFTEKLLSE